MKQNNSNDPNIHFDEAGNLFIFGIKHHKINIAPLFEHKPFIPIVKQTYSEIKIKR